MLHVLLNYHWESGISPILFNYGFLFREDRYVKKLTSDSITVEATHDNEKKVLNVFCESEISFDGCKELHGLLKHLAIDLSAGIEDTNAMLGYDNTGKPAYLYHGFHQWSTFLDEAKYRSLEGFTVQIFDGKALLGEGMLIHANIPQENKSGRLETPSCSIISTEGEEIFFGNQLSIVPVTDATRFSI